MDGGNILINPRTDGRPRISSSQNAQRCTTQPPLIRDTILSFLVRPHTTKEVANRIERPTSTATGHLRAMRKKGLVVRLSWGIWVRHDKCLNPPDHASVRRGHPFQDAVLRHLTTPRSMEQLEAMTGQTGDRLKCSLAALARRDLITRHPGPAFVIKRPG